MDRRSFLKAGGATAAIVPFANGAAAQTTAATGDAKLNALFEEIFQDRVKRNPALATSLGLDKGPNAHLKSELDVRPAAQARKEDLALAKRDLARVRSIPPATLSEASRLNRDVVIYQAETGMIPAERFNIDGVQRPYPIFQQGGTYFSTPDFLNSAHTIENAADAENRRRLSCPDDGILQQRCTKPLALPVHVDGEAAKDGHRNRIGHIAPDRARRQRQIERAW